MTSAWRRFVDSPDSSDSEDEDQDEVDGNDLDEVDGFPFRLPLAGKKR